MKKIAPEQLKKISVTTFFLALIFLGFAVFRDYGIGWDETDQRKIGASTLNYVARKLDAPQLQTVDVVDIPKLETYFGNDHGSLFELVLVVAEKFLKDHDSRNVFLLRHLLNYLFCLIGVYAVYALARRRFDDWKIGLLAASFLILSPRIFSDFFYNSKDAIFLAAFAVSANTLINFIIKPNARTAILHALACAVAIDIRLMALILLPLTVALLAIKKMRLQITAKEELISFSSYVIFLALFAVALWPYLWETPLQNFFIALLKMMRFSWSDEILYAGEVIRPRNLPWHYIPVWISITTPLLYLALFATGFALVLKKNIQRKFVLWNSNEELQDLIFFTLFFAPILAIILLHSVVYDGWRHMYFTYPALILLAMRGLVFLWQKFQQKRSIIIAITTAAMLWTIFQMIYLHPTQNVYFNILAQSNIKNHFDIDYWGVGNKSALEHILQNDPRKKITIRVDSRTPLAYTLAILQPEQRQRFAIVQSDFKADYVLNNYRNVYETDNSRYSKDYELFYELKIRSDEPFLSVFKSKDF
jgi:hypothetical protein